MSLKILFVTSECAPFRHTGGLGDVAGALPKTLRQRGHDVRVVMPLYRGIRWDELERREGALHVPTGSGMARGAVRASRLPRSDVPIYFLEHHHYFDRPELYDEYADNLERFTFLSRGALELSKALGFAPDVVHANDWPTALVPVYLETVEWLQPLHAAASVYSIHNMAHQGVFDARALPITGLGWEHLNANELEHFGAINLMKGALRHATMLSTVSPTYAREIQTGEHGCGLDGVLRRRAHDLRGILNGIDVDEWNPASDHFLAARYSRDDLAGKAACKAALQEHFGLPRAPDVPLVAAIGRLTHQKGFDVLAAALPRILDWNLQFVLLGSGDRGAEHAFSELAAARGDRFRCHLGFDNALAHRIEAGSDFLVMPSRFEPCGLNQMYSHVYGTLPIVRATGGLVDTVQSYDESTGEGTGFVFRDLDPGAVADTVGWAVSTYHDRPWHLAAMRTRAMAQDYSWSRAAAAYEELYGEAIRRRSAR